MEDNSLMPIGKYRGEKMANVPADYLLWLYENGNIYGGLKQYIVGKIQKKSQKGRNKKLIYKNKILARKRVNQLKYNITKAEKKIYDALIREGIIFEFKKAFYNEKYLYIVDFYLINIFGKKYVIEIDGDSNNNEKSREYDLKKSFYLYHARRCCVKRFTNKEVFNDIDIVIDRICELHPRTTFDKYYSELEWLKR